MFWNPHYIWDGGKAGLAQSGGFQGGTWANIQYCFIIHSDNTFTVHHCAPDCGWQQDSQGPCLHRTHSSEDGC